MYHPANPELSARPLDWLESIRQESSVPGSCWGVIEPTRVHAKFMPKVRIYGSGPRTAAGRHSTTSGARFLSPTNARKPHMTTTGTVGPLENNCFLRGGGRTRTNTLVSDLSLSWNDPFRPQDHSVLTSSIRDMLFFRENWKGHKTPPALLPFPHPMTHGGVRIPAKRAGSSQLSIVAWFLRAATTRLFLFHRAGCHCFPTACRLLACD